MVVEGLGEMQILAKSLLKSCMFSPKQGSIILYHFPVVEGGLINFPSGKLEFLKSYSKFSRAFIREEFSGRNVEDPLGLSNCIQAHDQK